MYCIMYTSPNLTFTKLVGKLNGKSFDSFETKEEAYALIDAAIEIKPEIQDLNFIVLEEA